MTLNLTLAPVEAELKPRIIVIGVGGAGCNAVSNMITSNLEGVDFVVANTDAQSLALSRAERRIQLGASITNGLGSGARPDVGRAAAEEAIDLIQDHLLGSHMAFITAGMGGGTGTGSAPVVARAAREQGILTVGVVTKPFHFEGQHRMVLADEGIKELQQYVDTLIVIPNQNLFRVANEKTTFADAFKMADNVLYSGVRGVTDLMVMPGLINLDFADIRTVMGEMGKAMMGTGEGSGDRRAIEAAEAAISNPLLEDVSMKGARGLLINITGGLDMTLFEVDEAANRVRDEVDESANIIFGSTFDETMEGIIRVSIVSTGIDVDAHAMPRPTMIRLVDSAAKPNGTDGLPHDGNTYEDGSAADATLAAGAAEAAQAVNGGMPDAVAQRGTPPIRAQAAPGAYGQAAAAAATRQSHPLGPDAALNRSPRPAAPAPQPGGTFVAPRPMEPAPQRQAAPSAGYVLPAAHGGVKTAGEPRRSLNIFHRVTNAARDQMAAMSTGRESAPAEALELRGAPAPQSSAAELPQVDAQHSFSALDPSQTQASVDEQLVEIPAFLRRQAN